MHCQDQQKQARNSKLVNTCQTPGPLVETDNKYNKNIAAQTRLIVKRTQHSQNDTSEIRFLAKHNSDTTKKSKTKSSKNIRPSLR